MREEGKKGNPAQKAIASTSRADDYQNRYRQKNSANFSGTWEVGTDIGRDRTEGERKKEYLVNTFPKYQKNSLGYDIKKGGEVISSRIRTTACY